MPETPAYQVRPTPGKPGRYDICTRAGHCMVTDYPEHAALEICVKLNKMAKTNDEVYRRRLVTLWKREQGEHED